MNEQEDLSLMLDSELPVNSKSELITYIKQNTCRICPLEIFLTQLEEVPEEDLDRIRQIQKAVVLYIDQCKFSSIKL